MKMKIIFFFCFQLLTQALVKKISLEEQTANFWTNNGHEELLKELLECQITKKAKNIILFIGDGMGPSTIAAARIYKNQRMINSTLPDINLSFDSFANVGLVKTHSVDDYVADSSSTATAILTGIKVRSKVVGVGPDVYFEDCSSHVPVRDNLKSIGTMFYETNRSVGIVTTTRITHATPSALYAHVASRKWEYNVPINCPIDDIALQLFKNAEKFKVILGGGSDYFIPKSLNGSREDGRNLLLEWKQKMQHYKSILVTNFTSLRDIDLSQTDYLFGLFGKSHLDYDSERGDQPSLTDLTDTAIKVLSTNENGYFLLVEGGRIDHGHHNSKAILAILETLALDKAVSHAVKSTSFDDTLIIVTADHSHVFTVGSYEHRDVDITKKNNAIFGTEMDKKGHTSLLYANGPGFQSPRLNITDITDFTLNHVYSSGIPLEQETHGGEDIAVYVEGPWGHLINGLHQQSYIAYLMMYASCTGNYKNGNHCVNSNASKNMETSFKMLSLIVVIYMNDK